MEILKGILKTTMSNLATSSQNLNLLLTDSKNGLNRITSKLENTVGNVDNVVIENGNELKSTLRDIQTLQHQWIHLLEILMS
ncbi:MAG: hypothetical protein R3A12_13730 [Ignavibacteria bacterium]